ncbi:MAG: hypothetical protein U0359_35775 [Byssovorax sp.]
MRPLHLAFLLAFPFALAPASIACGGKVIADGTSLTGAGGGGTGGTGQSSSSVVSTGTVGTSTVGVTSTSTTGTSTTSVTSTSTGTVSVCDNTGNCQDPGGDTCVQCAVNGPCQAEIEACQANDQCIQYNDCTNNCGDPGCQQACAMKFPDGQKIFFALVDCVVCKVCVNDCKEIGAMFCP